MTVDLNTLKEGDVVHVRGTILHRAPGMGAACWTIECGSVVVAIFQSQIVHVEPRPIKVGDFVHFAGGQGKVLAIHEDDAWVEYGSYFGVNRGTVPVASLKRWVA